MKLLEPYTRARAAARTRAIPAGLGRGQSALLPSSRTCWRPWRSRRRQCSRHQCLPQVTVGLRASSHRGGPGGGVPHVQSHRIAMVMSTVRFMGLHGQARHGHHTCTLTHPHPRWSAGTGEWRGPRASRVDVGVDVVLNADVELQAARCVPTMSEGNNGMMRGGKKERPGAACSRAAFSDRVVVAELGHDEAGDGHAHQQRHCKGRFRSLSLPPSLSLSHTHTLYLSNPSYLARPRRRWSGCPCRARPW